MSSRRVTLIGAIPIPVGHEVEVTWYEVEERKVALFGSDTTETKSISAPIVVDQSTGIRYSMYEHFAHAGGYGEGKVNLERHALRTDLTPVERLFGRVIACSIVDVRFEGRGEGQFETELEISVDEAPFR